MRFLPEFQSDCCILTSFIQPMCIKKIDEDDDDEEVVADMFHCQPGVTNTEERVEWQLRQPNHHRHS